MPWININGSPAYESEDPSVRSMQRERTWVGEYDRALVWKRERASIHRWLTLLAYRVAGAVEGRALRNPGRRASTADVSDQVRNMPLDLP